MSFSAIKKFFRLWNFVPYRSRLPVPVSTQPLRHIGQKACCNLKSRFRLAGHPLISTCRSIFSLPLRKQMDQKFDFSNTAYHRAHGTLYFGHQQNLYPIFSAEQMIFGTGSSPCSQLRDFMLISGFLPCLSLPSEPCLKTKVSGSLTCRLVSLLYSLLSICFYTSGIFPSIPRPHLLLFSARAFFIKIKSLSVSNPFFS